MRRLTGCYVFPVGDPDTASPRATLERARSAFDAGDHLQTRRLCDQLARADDPELRREAADLRKRVSADPVQALVLAGCLAFFMVIVYVYAFR